LNAKKEPVKGREGKSSRAITEAKTVSGKTEGTSKAERECYTTQGKPGREKRRRKTKIFALIVHRKISEQRRAGEKRTKKGKIACLRDGHTQKKGNRKRNSSRWHSEA